MPRPPARVFRRWPRRARRTRRCDTLSRDASRPCRRRSRLRGNCLRAGGPGRPRPAALRRARRGRLPQRPAPGPERARQRSRARRLPGDRRRDRRTTTTSSRPTATCSTGYEGLDADGIAGLLQGRDLRRQARGRRAHLQPARRRDGRARHATASRTSTARRAPARCSARATRRPRTGCSSWTSSATSAARSSRRSPAARRATARSTTSCGRSRRTRRRTCRRRSTRERPGLRGRGGRRCAPISSEYVAGINAYIAEARLNPLEAARPSTRRSTGRRDRRLEGHRHGRDRARGRRDPRRGRRRRAGLRAGRCERARTRFGRRAGDRVWRDFRSADNPAAPMTVARRGRSPIRGGSGRRKAPALPDRGSLAGARRAGRRQRAAGADPVPTAPGAPPTGDPARVAGVPRRDVERHPGLRPAHGERPAARGLRPADGLLRAAGADGAGGPGAGHLRARRRLPGRQPLRADRPRPRLRLERHDLGPGHRRHLRRRSLRPRRRRRRIDSDRLPRPRPLRARSRRSSARTSGRPPRPTPRRPAARRCARSARGSGWSSGAARCAGGPVVYTRLRSTYMHEPDSGLAFSYFNDPDRITGPQAFQQAACAGRLHVQLVLRRRRSTSPTRTPATTRAARAGTDPDLPIRARPPQRVARATTRTPCGSSAFTPRREHPQFVDQAWTVGLEQQAGARATRRPTTTGATARPTARSCWPTACGRWSRGAQQGDAAAARRGDGGRGHRRPARRRGAAAARSKVIGTLARRGRASGGRRAAGLAARPAPTGSTRDRDGTYEHSRRDRALRRLVAALDARAVRAGARARRCSTAIDAHQRARQPPEQPRRPPRVGVAGRLARLRGRRPAAAAAHRGPAGLVARRTAAAARARAAAPRCERSLRAALDVDPPTLYGGDAVCAARPAATATRPASTRSGSGRSAASRSR